MKKVINYFIKLILVFLIFLVGGKEVLSQQCTLGQRYPIRENYSNYNWGNLKGQWYQGSNNSEWIPKYALPSGYPSYFNNIVEFKWSAPSPAYYSGLPSSICPGEKGPCEYWALGNYYVISGICQWFSPGWGCFGLRFSVSQTRTTWASNQDYNCNGIPNQYDTLPTHDWDETDSDGDGVRYVEDPWPNDPQKPGNTMFRRLFRFFHLSDGKKIDMFAKADTPADFSYWFYAMDSDGLVNDLVQNRSNWGYESYGSGSSKTYSQWKAEFSPGFVVGAGGSVIETLQNQIIVGVRVLPIGSWSGAKLKGMEVVTNGQGYVGFLFSNAEDSNVWKKWNGSSWVVYNNLRWDPSTPGWIVEEPLEGMSESEVEALDMDQ